MEDNNQKAYKYFYELDLYDQEQEIISQALVPQLNDIIVSNMEDSLSQGYRGQQMVQSQFQNDQQNNILEEQKKLSQYIQNKFQENQEKLDKIQNFIQKEIKQKEQENNRLKEENNQLKLKEKDYENKRLKDENSELKVKEKEKENNRLMEENSELKQRVKEFQNQIKVLEDKVKQQIEEIYKLKSENQNSNKNMIRGGEIQPQNDFKNELFQKLNILKEDQDKQFKEKFRDTEDKLIEIESWTQDPKNILELLNDIIGMLQNGQQPFISGPNSGLGGGPGPKPIPKKKLCKLLEINEDFQNKVDDFSQKSENYIEQILEKISLFDQYYDDLDYEQIDQKMKLNFKNNSEHQFYKLIIFGLLYRQTRIEKGIEQMIAQMGNFEIFDKNKFKTLDYDIEEALKQSILTFRIILLDGNQHDQNKYLQYFFDNEFFNKKQLFVTSFIPLINALIFADDLEISTFKNLQIQQVLRKEITIKSLNEQELKMIFSYFGLNVDYPNQHLLNSIILEPKDTPITIDIQGNVVEALFPDIEQNDINIME